MGNIAIRVEKLGKRYRIGAKEKQAMTLRESLPHLVVSPFGYLRSMLREPSEAEILWALRDVSFKVQPGEVLGIIGRNGAGKSTLLKVLSHITEPTVGKAELYGRVGSLLEVGTGFHPELTGRENIYMSGAILGMRRFEIKHKFDEIVAFSEVEKFIDTPVKRYSSGMYVRLAFAVAAHLEPEILLIDEVLAVGDVAFQKKCLGKMDEVVHQGRTVLFVSHNMIAIQSLCTRVIWLNNGTIKESGTPDQVVPHYLQTDFSASTEQMWPDISSAPGNDKVRIHQVCVRPENGTPSDPITMQTPCVVGIEFWNLVPGIYLDITLHFYTEQGVIAFGTGTAQEPVWHGRPFPIGLFRSICRIPGNFLNSGIHRVVLLVVKDHGSVIYRHDDALLFEVADSIEGRGAWYGKRVGVVRPMLEWTTEYASDEL